jgi:hypothetical protein
LGVFVLNVLRFIILWPNTISSIIIRPSLRNFYWSGYLHLL